MKPVHEPDETLGPFMSASSGEKEGYQTGVSP